MPRLRQTTIPWQQQRWTQVATELPQAGRRLRVLATDGGAPYPLPFEVVRADGSWRNAKHDRELEVRVTAWRYVDV